MKRSSFLKLISSSLPNGYVVTSIDKSETILDEIWQNHFYDRHFAIKPGMIVFDLGANLGFFSLYAASMGASVYSFEPEKENFNLLKHNINQNNLSDKIFPYNLAIAKDRKMMDLYLQDYDKQFASGMVTSSIELAKSFSNESYLTQSVSCISFSEAMTRTGCDTIDLLKIDCEGSEFEILESAEPEEYVKIKNIVMETHNAYSEKELFYLVKKLGFDIISYEKRGGVYQTGYLFAANSLYTKNPPELAPILITSTPDFGIVGREIKIDISKSFSANSSDQDLFVTWSIEGNILEKHDLVLIHIFENSGFFAIKIKISDGDLETENIIRLWIFNASYFSIKNPKKLSMDKYKNLFNISRPEFFTIKKDLFPDYWLPKSLVYGIKIPHPCDPNITISFNGSKTKLSKPYTQFRIDEFCRSTDFNLEVIPSRPQEIMIEWWIDNNEPEQIELKAKKEEDGNIVQLNLQNESKVCSINTCQQFLLPYNYLPTNWNPDLIVIGVEIMNYDISGSIKILDKTYTFPLHWIEMRVDRNNIKDDLLFEIFLDSGTTRVKINWWTDELPKGSKNLKKFSLVNSDGEKLFCIYPFSTLTVTAYGLTSCCWMKGNTYVPINGKSFLEVFRGSEFTKYQESLKNETYRYCRLKDCEELNGDRMNCFTIKQLRVLFPDIADYIEGRTKVFKGYPHMISMAYDNNCNLSCPTCSRKNQPSISTDEKERYLKEIEKMGKNLKILFLAGMGDPFGTIHYRKWMFNFQKKYFPNLENIIILTNGMLWTPEIWEKVSEDFKSFPIEAMLSIDGASKETFEENRKGGNFEIFLKNLEFISSLKKNKAITIIKLFFVVQNNNYEEIPAMIELARKYSCNSITFRDLENWGNFKPKEFDIRNVTNKKHKNYKNYLKIINSKNVVNAEGIRVEFV